MPAAKNVALYRNWCQEWLQAIDVGGNSEKLRWGIWAARAGDSKNPARGTGFGILQHAEGNRNSDSPPGATWNQGEPAEGTALRLRRQPSERMTEELHCGCGRPILTGPAHWRNKAIS